MASFLNSFDNSEILRDAEKYGSRKVKRDLVKDGYTNQISLYGTVTSTATGEGWTPRIELMSKQRFSEKTIALAYDFFKELKPKWHYSIWVLDDEGISVKMVWKYEREPRR